MLTPWAHPLRGLGGKFYLHVTLLMLGAWAAPFIARFLARLGDRMTAAAGDRATFAIAAMRGVVVACMIGIAVIYLDSQTSFIYFQF